MPYSNNNVQLLRRGPWSWPGMTCRGHCAVSVGVYLFRQMKMIVYMRTYKLAQVPVPAM